MIMATRKESPFNKYELLEEIGDGSFGSVHKAKNKLTQDTVAIKVMKKKFNSSSECHQLKEYKTWSQMTPHDNIVQLYETFLGPNKDFYFVMEYANGRNLYQFINQHKDLNQLVEAKEIQTILYQIMSALDHIHIVEGIFHRDLKPENLLLEYHNNGGEGDNSRSLSIKLADFGLATEIKSKSTFTSYVSTRWYRAPEVLLKSTHYSFPIDLWAVGTIFAELVSLCPLFPGHSEIDQLFRICQVLGSPGTLVRPSKKNYLLKNIEQHNKDFVGIGGEWDEGLRLAHKMGFDFPKILPKVDCISTVLKPSEISDDGLDLLSRLLKFDPQNRIDAAAALSHPYFFQQNKNDIKHQRKNKPAPIQTRTSNAIHPLSLKPISSKPSLFELPIIPLSPFQFEEDYYSQWDVLLRKAPNNNNTVYNHNSNATVEGHQSTAPAPAVASASSSTEQPNNITPLLTRTASFPSIYSFKYDLFNTDEEPYSPQGNTNMIKRSVSDLSIVPTLPVQHHLHQQQQLQQEEAKASTDSTGKQKKLVENQSKKNPITRKLRLWPKKHLVV